jgi:hypothetical protein
MLNRFIAAVILSTFPVGAMADHAEPPSMRFEWVKEGPAQACGDNCREWIAAIGPITPDTFNDFQLFSEVRDVKGATIVLDSGGGSVLASLELGRQFRKAGVTTSVGRTVKIKSAPTEPQRARLSPRGECASMCVFALLGGVQRTVPPEARVMVHQIWPGTKRNDASAEQYTAEEVVRIQRDVGRIAKYTVEMGGDIELFEIAMRIPPWEKLRGLSAQELRRLRLNTVEAPIETPTSGRAGVRPLPKQSSSTTERGWTLAGDTRGAMSRRHVLTVEGEEVGRFQLVLQCGETPTSYRIAYEENRTVVPNGEAPRIREVNVWVNGERSTLEVESSKLLGREWELQSVATGELTQDFLERLTKDPAAVMIVSTYSSEDFRTSIRVGAHGFPQHFPRFAQHCSQVAQRAQHAAAQPKN